MTSAAGHSEHPARTFDTIGVIGLGTMGAGIAEVFARNGFTVIGVEQNEHGLERGREHLEHSTGRAVSRGKMTEEEQREVLDRISFSTDLKDLAHADLVVEAVVESLAAKTRHLPRARRDRRSGRHPRDQHVLALGHRDLHRQHPPGTGHRRALLQPGAGAEVRRDRAHRRHRAARARRRGGPRRPARQEPGHLRRQGRLHRQHAALRLPQPRGRDVRGPVRLARGHRRRDALRLRLPDGTAGAARPDRPRHGVRDPRHDVQAGPRPPARARAVPQADGHRRPARSEVRPRLLHLRRARHRRDRPRRADPVPDDRPRFKHDIATDRRRRHRDDGHRGSSRSSPRLGTT